MDPAADSSSADDSSSKDRHVTDPVREAISTINDGNGVDIDGIYEFVKARRDLMPDYKDVLEAELNRRVSENELEKVDNLYRIIDVVSSENTTEAESEEPANTSSDIPTSSSSPRETFDDVLVKAIRTLNDGNGADIDEICEYVQGRSFDLGSQPRKLVEEYLMNMGISHTELEKVGNHYIIVSSEDTNETTETESKSVEDPDDQKNPASSSSDYAKPYGDMPETIVIKAIATMDYGFGVDIDEIYEFIEKRYNIPADYMKILEDELNRRVSENELEKVDEHGYRVRDVTSDNIDEAQSQAVAVADQIDPTKSSSSSDATTYSGNTPYCHPVMDAVSTINGGNGVDIDGILEFIQAKYDKVFSPDYRKHLEKWLKTRVSLCILEKVEETHYKILNLTPEKVAEISEATAKAVAVSDQKELEAKEASEAADRAKKVLEENELVLKMAKEAIDRCARGN